MSGFRLGLGCRRYEGCTFRRIFEICRFRRVRSGFICRVLIDGGTSSRDEFGDERGKTRSGGTVSKKSRDSGVYEPGEFDHDKIGENVHRASLKHISRGIHHAPLEMRKATVATGRGDPVESVDEEQRV